MKITDKHCNTLC